ncbi:unnamed protein product [Fraxinus pennsylvanica]|uniref:Plant bHLH transcription factor ACT-like domain-containing protein n=1 Tax=Fraxinus pennsylvanica TaxID=56036 RepID=A0AAD1ZGI9_9LAMI|nr:unnamed protein product [Fraxinus pennsylvanica]
MKNSFHQFILSEFNQSSKHRTAEEDTQKMDEASVLENAIRYSKYLQERVDILEEQARNPTVHIKKSKLVVDDEGSSSNEQQSAPSIEARVCGKHVLLRICCEKRSSSNEQQSAPSIEARVCGKHVLLRICCEKRKGVLAKILCEIEKLNLAVVNTSVVPFGSSSHDINIVAEKEREFSLAVEELVQNLNAVFHRAV